MTTCISRPDSIDLLFLRSFPDPFKRVQWDKNKNKRKKRHKLAWKYNNLRKKNYFLKIIFSSPFHECTRRSEKHHINWVWQYDTGLEIQKKKHISLHCYHCTNLLKYFTIKALNSILMVSNMKEQQWHHHGTKDKHLNYAKTTRCH